MLTFLIGVGLINQLLFQQIDPAKPLTQPEIIVTDKKKINNFLNTFERYNIYEDLSDAEYQKFIARLVVLIKAHQQRQGIRFFDIESVSFREKYGKNAFENGPSDIPFGPGVGSAGRDIDAVHDTTIYLGGAEIIHLKTDPTGQFGVQFNFFSKNPNIKFTSPMIRAMYGVLRVNPKGEVMIQPDFNKDKIGDPFVIVITARVISCLTWNSVSGYQPITNSKECEAIMEKLKKAPPSPKSPLYKKPLKNYKR